MNEDVVGVDTVKSLQISMASSVPAKCECTHRSASQLYVLNMHASSRAGLLAAVLFLSVKPVLKASLGLSHTPMGISLYGKARPSIFSREIPAHKTH